MMRNTKSGSMIVEAAVILPVFIIAAVTIGYCINMACCTENVLNVMCDESRLAAAMAPVNPTSFVYTGSLRKRVEEEAPLVDDYKITSVNYMNSDGIIKINSEFTVKNRMPISFHDDFKKSCNVKFRGFIGRDNSADVFSFDEMERNGDSAIVWVFPVAGERYHKETCPYIKVDPRQITLSPAIRKEYTPCHLCRPQNLKDGQMVYCFTSAGHAYHTGDCSTVDRYVISKTRGEAESEGYSPCSKCGGS